MRIPLSCGVSFFSVLPSVGIEGCYPRVLPSSLHPALCFMARVGAHVAGRVPFLDGSLWQAVRLRAGFRV